VRSYSLFSVCGVGGVAGLDGRLDLLLSLGLFELSLFGFRFVEE